LIITHAGVGGECRKWGYFVSRPCVMIETVGSIGERTVI